MIKGNITEAERLFAESNKYHAPILLLPLPSGRFAMLEITTNRRIYAVYGPLATLEEITPPELPVTRYPKSRYVHDEELIPVADESLGLTFDFDIDL